MGSWKEIIGFKTVEVFLSLSICLSCYLVLTLNVTGIVILSGLALLQINIKGRWNIFIDFLTKTLRICDHFTIRRFYEETIPQDEKTMFGFHPHSIYGLGILINVNHPAYPGEKLTNMSVLASRFALSLPIIGAAMKWWGVVSCDSANLKSLMKRGVDIGLVPGGYEEASLTCPKKIQLFLKERKGFIKYALKYGYSLRPVFIMNEHKAFKTYEGFKTLRLFLNKLKIPGAIYWGSYGLLFPPSQVLDTVIGRAIKSDIKYSESEQPTIDEINKYHQLYINQIESIYELHKHKNGQSNIPLKIV